MDTRKKYKIKDDVKIIGGRTIEIEDTCERIFGPCWEFNINNPAIRQFITSHEEIFNGSYFDNWIQCYYGKVDYLGYIVREDEIEIID